jgi:hypothetical protein
MKIMIQRLQKQNEKLRQDVTEYEVLDAHIKKENELLKSWNQKLRDKKENLIVKLKKVVQLGRKWETKAKRNMLHCRVLKRELKEMKKDGTSRLDILAQATDG